MELRQLQAFLTVANTLNFSRAAEILFISQPSLSKQIADLEQELNAKLFNRTRRMVQLTPAGTFFYEQVKRNLSSLEQAKAIVRQFEDSRTEDERLSIGCELSISSSTVLQRMICSALICLKKFYPQLKIEFSLFDLHDIDQALKEDVIDCAICTRPNDDAPSPLPWAQYELMQHDLILQYYAKEPMEETQENLIKLLSTNTLYMLRYGMNRMIEISALLHELDVSPHIEFIDSPVIGTLNVMSGSGVILTPSYLTNIIDFPDIQSFHLKDATRSHLTVLRYNPDNENPMIRLFIEELRRTTSLALQ